MTQSPISRMRPLSSAIGMNSPGRIEAPFRMLPSDQGFHAAHLAGRDVDLGLVVQGKLILRQRSAKLRLDLQALAREAHDAGIEESERLAAAALGEIHRFIGARQQLLRTGAVVWIARNSNAGADVQLQDRELIGLRQARPSTASDEPFDFLDRIQAPQQQQKFIAAGSRDGVRRSQDRQQALGNVFEQRIAGAVAQRIVDDLEAVQIEYAYRERLAVVDGMVQALHEQHAIGNSRQRIVSCLALQFEIRVGERFVPLLEHVNGVAKLLAPVMQPKPQHAAEYAEQYASAQGGHEA